MSLIIIQMGVFYRELETLIESVWPLHVCICNMVVISSNDVTIPSFSNFAA